MKFAVTLIERRRVLSSYFELQEVASVVFEIKVIGGTFSVTYVQNVAME